MKVRKIDLGYVIPVSEDLFNTSAAAKQAMREKIAHERKRHGLQK